MPTLLCRLGHVASTSDLRAHGVTAWQLRRGVAEARVTRPRRGVYACAHVDSDIRRAAQLGGAITCVTVLRRAGVWAGHDQRVHVQVLPGRAARRSRDVHLHWVEPHFGLASLAEAEPTEALRLAMHCLDSENAVAALESAGHEGLLQHADIRRVFRGAPRRVQRETDELHFSSGSGNETVVRLRLQHVGFSVEPQGYVPGLGHQDLVVEDCVGLEIDGRRWHGEDRFALDRDRDIQAESLGRHVLRLRAAHIFETWPHTLAAIERAVSDAKALRRMRGR